MPRYTVLKQNTEFRTAYYRGHSFVHPAVITYVRKTRIKDRNGQPVVRMGITTGKKIGHAVQRNRCRRVIRAAYAELYPQLKGSYDLVFVARNRLLSMKSTALVPILRRQLQEAGVL